MKTRLVLTAAVGAFPGLIATPLLAQQTSPAAAAECTRCEQRIVDQLVGANRRLDNIEAALGRLAAQPRSRRPAVVIDFPERLATPGQFGFTPTYHSRRSTETATATAYCTGLGYQRGQALFWEVARSGPGPDGRILRLVCFDD